MSKKYFLIHQENVCDLNKQRTGFNSGFDDDIAKEVEVLDDATIKKLLSENTRLNQNSHKLFTDYLKANNLLIVKIIE